MKRLLSLAAVMLCVVGCHPNLTPVASIAKYGGDVISTARQLSKTARDLEAAHVLKTVDAAKVVMATYDVERLGKELAQALRAFEGATDAPTVAEKKAAILRLINDMGDKLSLVKVSSGLQAQLITLADKMFTIFTQIRAGIALKA